MSIFDRFRSSREFEEEIVRLRREIRSLEQGASQRSGSSEPLLAVARALREARSVEAFAGPALVAILDMAGGTRAALVAPDETGLLRAVVARTAQGDAIPAETFVLSQGIAREATEAVRPIATGSATEDARFSASKSVKVYGIGSVLCLPVRRHSEPTACLYLDGGSGGLRRADPAQLLAVADLVSIALDRLATDVELSRRERLEAMGLAAASIAHDLRTPLATAELALESVTSASDAGAKAVSAAARALARAREIAQHLAVFARGSEQRLAVVRIPLGEVMSEHLEEWRPAFERARVAPEVNAGYAGPVRADRSALLRVLSNVVKNALDAMPAGPPKAVLAYRTSATGGRATITISDSGPGIPADVLPKLFRPFATFGKPGGCGLGLAISRDLVRGMGGAIRVESEVGRGASVQVDLDTA